MSSGAAGATGNAAGLDTGAMRNTNRNRNAHGDGHGRGYGDVGVPGDLNGGMGGLSGVHERERIRAGRIMGAGMSSGGGGAAAAAATAVSSGNRGNGAGGRVHRA